MPITLQINKKQLEATEPLKVHFLPAKIDGDGEANVDEFFNNYTRTEGGHLTNALRGYPLLGEQLMVPDGYRAVVFQEAHQPLDEDAERVLKMTGSFERFHYWNYDKVPSKADGYKQALQMLSISEELAEPLTEQEVLEEIQRHNQEDSAKEN